MKNYELQVKEIPIIFRGSVIGADYEAAAETINYSSFPSKMGDNYWIDTSREMVPASFNIYSLDTIYVEFNGVLYGPLPKYSKAGGIYVSFGARTYATSTGNAANFSEYPFALQQTRNSYNLINCLVPEGTESATVKIWAEEPQFVNGKKLFSADLTGNGQINRFYARFACGENGTLHLKPYVILNGNIRVDLCNFAQGGDQYIAGDNEEIGFDCYVPIETHAVAYVEAENTGEYPSLVDAAMTVQYEDFIESESIVGYEGVNLRRGRR